MKVSCLVLIAVLTLTQSTICLSKFKKVESNLGGYIIDSLPGKPMQLLLKNTELLLTLNFPNLTSKYYSQNNFEYVWLDKPFRNQVWEVMLY